MNSGEYFEWYFSLLFSEEMKMYSRPQVGEFSLKLCNVEQKRKGSWLLHLVVVQVVFWCHVEPNEPSAAAALLFEKYKLSFS